MFTTLIVQPLFNLLTFIYAILPGHNYGLAIIIFTAIIRLLMWPLVKKQLHHTKAMRELQPELRRIKQEAKGDRQKESAMVMELYREREINPFASLGLALVQIPIFLALYSGLSRIVKDPTAIVNFSYPWVQDLSWMKELAGDITKFDSTLLGFVDLKRSALGSAGGVYWPAMLIVISSVVAQFYQSKQLMPNDQKSRGLRKILKDASTGKQADQTEVNAAVGRSTRYLLPALIFMFTVNIASALSLYWLVSGLVAFVQQSRILKQDVEELEESVDKKSSKKVIEGEVLPPKKTKKTKKSPSKKRRRK